MSLWASATARQVARTRRRSESPHDAQATLHRSLSWRCLRLRLHRWGDRAAAGGRGFNCLTVVAQSIESP